jgi:hypothetical protein
VNGLSDLGVAIDTEGQSKNDRPRAAVCAVQCNAKLLIEMYQPSAVTKQSEIQAAIKEVERSLAADVVRIRYEIGEDWSGQWAIFFRIVLTDDAAKRRLRDVATEVAGIWSTAPKARYGMRASRTIEAEPLGKPASSARRCWC